MDYYNVTGQEYDAVIPDTLDLVERAELSIRGLANSIDPVLNSQYFGSHICCREPHMFHHASADTTCDPKFAESFPMMRIMSASTCETEKERSFIRELLSRLDSGLYWDRYSPKRPWRNNYGNYFYGHGKNEDVANVGANGRMIRALIALYEITNDSVFEKNICEIIDSLKRIAIYKDNYCYYPEKGGWGEPCSYPRSGWLDNKEALKEAEGAEGSILAYHGHQAYAAANWYALSGSKESLELAACLSRYMMLPKFWGGVPDLYGRLSNHDNWIGNPASEPPNVAGSELGHWFTHFHGRAIGLRGILAYGLAAADDKAIQFVRRSYEFSLTQGIPRIGWINCSPLTANLNEGCSLGDLVGLAVRLSDASAGDYWDDVDAVVRNHLIEQQLNRPDLLEHIIKQFADTDCSWPGCSNEAQPGKLNYQNVVQNLMGSYANLSSPDCIDCIPPYDFCYTAGCCTGNATQGLYYAWEGIVRENGNTATVNLLLNRTAKLLDIDSYLPYEGKVIIKNKAAKHILVRMPYWVSKKDVTLEIMGNYLNPVWTGNKILLDSLPPQIEICIKFPISQIVQKYTINANTPEEKEYTCTLKGGTLVDISPRDTSENVYPLYLRENLKTGSISFKKAKRFVADKTFKNW